PDIPVRQHLIIEQRKVPAQLRRLIQSQLRRSLRHIDAQQFRDLRNEMRQDLPLVVVNKCFQTAIDDRKRLHYSPPCESVAHYPYRCIASASRSARSLFPEDTAARPSGWTSNLNLVAV